MKERDGYSMREENTEKRLGATRMKYKECKTYRDLSLLPEFVETGRSSLA